MRANWMTTEIVKYLSRILLQRIENQSKGEKKKLRLRGSKGATGGTGVELKGAAIGTLYGGEWDCDATHCSRETVQRGRVKTTTGNCNDTTGQWQAGMMHNLGKGLGLATPDATPSASSQWNNQPSSIPGPGPECLKRFLSKNIICMPYKCNCVSDFLVNNENVCNKQ